MWYKESLEAAGAKVLAFETFGSYQGDWLARVEYNGQSGWIKDYFGSCPGCDSFEAELGCEDTNDEFYQSKLSEFGKQYLDRIISHEECLKEVSANKDWDLSADDMVNFVEQNY